MFDESFFNPLNIFILLGSSSAKRKELFIGFQKLIQLLYKHKRSIKSFLLDGSFVTNKAIRKKYYSDKNKLAVLSQGYIEHIVQFKYEMKEYEDMIKAPFPEVLQIHNLNEINRSIVRLRIARKITQEEFAQKIGCKQSDTSRFYLNVGWSWNLNKQYNNGNSP